MVIFEGTLLSNGTRVEAVSSTLKDQEIVILAGVVKRISNGFVISAVKQQSSAGNRPNRQA